MLNKSNFDVGTIITLYGRQYEVTYVLGENLCGSQVETGHPRKFTFDELSEYDSLGKLTVETHTLSQDSPARLSDSQKFKLQVKKVYIHYALKSDFPGSQACLTELIKYVQEKYPKLPAISPSTLARWVRQYRRSHDQIVRADQNHKKGNRARRFDARIEGLLISTI